MDKWEYKTVHLKSKTSFMGGKFDYSLVDERLKELGNYGWELVNVVAINKGHGSTEGLIFFLKRNQRY